MIIISYINFIIIIIYDIAFIITYDYYFSY